MLRKDVQELPSNCKGLKKSDADSSRNSKIERGILRQNKHDTQQQQQEQHYHLTIKREDVKAAADCGQARQPLSYEAGKHFFCCEALRARKLQVTQGSQVEATAPEPPIPFLGALHPSWRRIY